MDILKELDEKTQRVNNLKSTLKTYQRYMTPIQVLEMAMELESIDIEIKELKNSLVKPMEKNIVELYSQVLSMKINIHLQ
jgi:hypothetical protein